MSIQGVTRKEQTPTEDTSRETLQSLALTLARLELQLQRDEFWNRYADQRIAHIPRERALQEIETELCYPEKVQIADSVDDWLSSSNPRAEKRVYPGPFRVM